MTLLLRAACPAASVPAYVIDAPYLYRRGGSPYQDSQGAEWPDNLQRFALLGWVAAHLAQGELDPDWHADSRARPRLACGAGLRLPARPPARREAASVFTVHNLAFQGLFPHARLGAAGPAVALHVAVGTRIPRPAVVHEGRAEVRRPHHHRQPDLRPRDRHARVRLRAGRRDPRPRRRRLRASSTASTTRSGTRPPTAPLPQRYDAGAAPAARPLCKAALQSELGLASHDRARRCSAWSAALTSQKGLDLVLAALPELHAHGRAVGGAGHRRAGAGSGLPHRCAMPHPGRVAVLHRLRRGRARTG